MSFVEGDYELPGSNWDTGRALCQGPGTNVQMRATSLSCLSLTIKSHNANNATVTVRGTSVGVSTHGFPLANTPESISLDLDDVSKVWINGTVNDEICWFALRR